MEPFKNLIDAARVWHAAAELQRHAGAGFDGKRFTALATDGLDALELKARALHVCTALEATLPSDFDAAAALIEAALAPPQPEPAPGPLNDAPPTPGLQGWILWPVGEYVARRGLQRPERALQTLHALTQRFTAEWAIRPIIVSHPELTFATLRRWCGDPSAHVRRLVSEGSRPRLPWGLQLKTLVKDPAPTLPLLRALQDDTSAYVRRSVANHLNDIAKDHPALIAAWLAEHLPGAGPERRALLRHASRTLINRGDAPVLRAWGIGAPLRGSATLRVSPARVTLGGAVQLTLVLKSASARKQKLAIDYAVHHVRADGSTAPKVFKGWVVELAPHAELTLAKRHPVRPITTRRYHAGRHVVVARINGAAAAEAAFTLQLQAGRSTPMASD